MASTTNKSWDGSESRFSDAAYKRSCLVKGTDKASSHLPVREPDGTLNLNALSAAAGRIGSVKGISPDERKSAARKLIGLYKANGMTPPSSLKRAAGQSLEEAAIEEGPPVLAGELGARPEPTTSTTAPRRMAGTRLRQGASGAPVRRVQRALGAVDGAIPLAVPVDGRFGPLTGTAVEAFQQERGLQVDGVVGRETMDALEGRRPSSPGPLRAHHLRKLGLALGRRGGGSRRRLQASGEEGGDSGRELLEADEVWADFGREIAEAFLPGGGGGGEESIGGAVDNDGDNDESPDDVNLAPGTGTLGTPSARVRVAQRALTSTGHYTGEVDGEYGSKTVGAVKSFQTSVGKRPTGHLDSNTLEDLDENSNAELVESMRRHESKHKLICS